MYKIYKKKSLECYWGTKRLAQAHAESSCGKINKQEDPGKFWKQGVRERKGKEWESVLSHIKTYKAMVIKTVQSALCISDQVGSL